MEYIDWIISSVIFLGVITFIFMTLPQMLNLTNKSAIESNAKIIFNDIAPNTELWEVNIENNDNIYPYFINTETNLEGQNPIYFDDKDNKLYSVVKKNTKNYNTNSNFENYLGPVILYEDFKNKSSEYFELDFNFIENVYDVIKFNESAEIISKKEFNNTTFKVTFLSDYFTAYFNKNIDETNLIECTYENNALMLRVIKNNNTHLEKTKYIESDKEWKTMFFGEDEKNKHVFCALDDEIIIEDLDSEVKSGFVSFNISKNTLIENIKVYQNNNTILNKDSVETTITDNDLSVKKKTNEELIYFNFYNNFFNKNIEFNIDLQKSINIEFLKNFSIFKNNENNETKGMLFHNTNEMWIFKNNSEEFEINNNNLEFFNISNIVNFYIEEYEVNNNKEHNLYFTTSLEPYENKEYIIVVNAGKIKSNGYNVFPFFDDFTTNFYNTWDLVPETEYVLKDFENNKKKLSLTKGGVFLKNPLNFNIENNYSVKTSFEVYGNSENTFTFSPLISSDPYFVEENQNYNSLFGFNMSEAAIEIIGATGEENKFDIVKEKIETTPKNKQITNIHFINDLEQNIIISNPITWTLDSEEPLAFNNNLKYISFGSTIDDPNINYLNIEHIFVRKNYDNKINIDSNKIDNEIYKIKIINESNEHLKDFQIKITEQQLPIINSDNINLKIYEKTNNQVNEIKHNQILLGNYEDKQHVIFDFFSKQNNQKIDCNYKIEETKIVVYNCDEDETIIKIRFRNKSYEDLDLEYPKINITKKKENIITESNLNSLNPTSYQLEVSNQKTINIKKGREFDIETKPYSNFATYIDAQGNTKLTQLNITPFKFPIESEINLEQGLIRHYDFKESEIFHLRDIKNNKHGTIHKINQDERNNTFKINNFIKNNSLLMKNIEKTYIEIPTSGFNKNAGSLNIWIKPISITPEAMVFGHQLVNNRFYIGFDSSSKLNIGFAEKKIITEVDLGQKWNNLTLTYDSGTYNFYNNGLFVMDGTYEGEINFQGFAHLGWHGGCTWTNHFNGYIGETRIYDRALKPVEVEELYKINKNNYLD